MNASATSIRVGHSSLGTAWLLMCAALGLHVADEALTGFLAVYNPTVLALRASLGFWPMPPFGFREWITGLAIGIGCLLLLTPFAFQNARLARPLFYIVAIVGVLNAVGHTLATVFGRTVATVRFERPAPGFLSSPIMLICAVYLLVQLRRTRVMSARNS